MANPRGRGPRDVVKGVLGCDDQIAEVVVRNLGGAMAHDPTRAFITRAWHLSTTTVPVGGTDRDVFVAEGQRQVALFMVACAQTGLRASTFHDGEDGL